MHMPAAAWAVQSDVIAGKDRVANCAYLVIQPTPGGIRPSFTAIVTLADLAVSQPETVAADNACG